MLTKTRIDRRREKTRTFRPGLPLFMQVPKPLAGIGLAGSAYIAVLASHSAPSVAFGPFFILICAFGAWFVGNLFALVLGLFVVSVQILTEHAIALHSGPLVMALQLFSALAVVLMLGVARAALETEWRFARVDPLTGALNRKAFFEAIEKEKGLPGPAALVFADVDGLKRLNDLAGHEAGDEALRDFSARVRRAVRKDDIFARIGGDEFVVFLKVCDLRAADIVAQRLHSTLNLDHEGCNTKLRCSLGILVLPAGSKSIDSELKQADALMYEAKRAQKGLVIATLMGDAVYKLASPRSVNSSPCQVRLSVRIEAVPKGCSEKSVAA